MASACDTKAPATFHDDRSPSLIAARTDQSPAGVGAPIDMYATPRGSVSPENRSPGANAPVVSRFTSPESVESENRLVATLAAESIARHNIEPCRKSVSPVSSSVPATGDDESLSTLRLMWRRRQAVSVCG